MSDQLQLIPDVAYITPFVNVRIGGIDFPLRFTMRSVVNVLEKDGRSIMNMEDWNSLPIEDVAELLVMATEHVTPKRTASDFLELLDAPSAYAVITALQGAFQTSNEGDPERVRPFRLGHEMLAG
jgi:hypothetical protein